MIAALFMVCLLVSAGAAAADDACLTGAPTLNDQRALIYVRDGIEAACPCASYTGGRGLNRAAYRKCARQFRDAALNDATLRSRCKRTAIRQYHGATCGTNRVACGELKASSHKLPVRCHVRSAKRCVDRRAIEAQACTAQTRCADVVDWTAGTCDDVRTPGSFATGVRIVTYTKQSVVNPSQQRVLNTVIWYPAPAGSSPIDPQYQGVVGAAVDNSAGPYPVVMFSHGSCGFPTQSKFLWPLIASRGFVVVAPPHPGNTLAEFPTCSTPAAKVSSAAERPQDILFVLDQVLAANASLASPFFGALDANRIGMAGHSFGGYTTYLVVAADARFKVALPMAPAVPGSPLLTIPSLTMLSQVDSYVNNDAIELAYANAQSPKYSVEIGNAGHFAYSDGCFPSPDCNPPTTLTQDESHAVVLRWVVPFLEKHLAGRDGFVPFLTAPAPPGVVFVAN